MSLGNCYNYSFINVFIFSSGSLQLNLCGRWLMWLHKDHNRLYDRERALSKSQKFNVFDIKGLLGQQGWWNKNCMRHFLPEIASMMMVEGLQDRFVMGWMTNTWSRLLNTPSWLVPYLCWLDKYFLQITKQNKQTNNDLWFSLFCCCLTANEEFCRLTTNRPVRFKSHPRT